MENPPNWQKIILIDDDSLLNLIHKKILDIIGYNGIVLDFKDGFQAIKFIYREIETTSKSENDSILIILDLEMPTLNGWGFLESFQKLDINFRKQFKIIVSSSSTNPEDIKRAIEFEIVSEYIPKPLNLEILSRLIKGFDGKEKLKL